MMRATGFILRCCYPSGLAFSLMREVSREVEWERKLLVSFSRARKGCKQRSRRTVFFIKQQVEGEWKMEMGD